MRLLHLQPTEPGGSILKSTELQPPTQRPPRYGILSHTWGADEILFENVEDLNSTREKSVYYSSSVLGKYWNACHYACAEGIQYFWIDTCCIDKKNSTELSEAINSMFRYYSESEVCYVYLVDVPDADDIYHRHSKFRQSRWFERGWTLQELLAPKEVRFYSQGWKLLGDKRHLKGLISSITRIPEDVLAGGDCQPPARSLAEVLSWASLRQTTVVEDGAYSLLGLLDINMPLLYGEGPKAFLRLQEELLRRYDDESLFAWEAPPNDALAKPYHGLLSPSLSYFEASHRFRRPDFRTKLDESDPKILTGKGISLSFPRIDVDRPNGLYLAQLDCTVHGTLQGHVQPAIQIQHLHGDQYARVDIHHLHSVRLDQTIGSSSQFHGNCRMLFPGRPTPPQPITGFITKREFKSITHRARVIEVYPPERWVVIGSNSDHLILHLNPDDIAFGPETASSHAKSIGMVTLQIFRKKEGDEEKEILGTSDVVIGLEIRKGHYAGAVEQIQCWGLHVARKTGMTTASAFNNLPSRLLSERPTEVRFKNGKGFDCTVEFRMDEKQFPGRVLYSLSLARRWD